MNSSKFSVVELQTESKRFKDKLPSATNVQGKLKYVSASRRKWVQSHHLNSVMKIKHCFDAESKNPLEISKRVKAVQFILKVKMIHFHIHAL